MVERLRGIDDVVGRSAYDLTLFNIETLEQRRAALRRFARRDRVDGVIVISLPLRPTEVRALHRDGVPTVLVDVAHALLPNVAIDDVAGGALAAGHLLAAGHRNIAFVGDVENNPFAFASSQRRLEGLRRVMSEARVALPARYVRRGPFGREIALELTRELLALRRRPTAIFAASDVQAFGVLDAAARAGLTVPGDLSVIGFDDIELAAAIGLPRCASRCASPAASGPICCCARSTPRKRLLRTRRPPAAGPRGRGAPDGFATSVVIRHIRLDTRRRGASLEPVPLLWRSAAGERRRPWRRGPGHAYHHPPHPIRRGYGRRRPVADTSAPATSPRARSSSRDAADHAKAGAPLSPHGLRRGPRAGRGIGPDQGARALRSRLRHRLPALRGADHDRRDAPLAARHTWAVRPPREAAETWLELLWPPSA